MQPPADILDSAVLTYLVDRYPGPVDRDELARAFAGDDWASSVSALRADGLVVREGTLHFASRAAIRAAELT